MGKWGPGEWHPVTQLGSDKPGIQILSEGPGEPTGITRENEIVCVYVWVCTGVACISVHIAGVLASTLGLDGSIPQVQEL